MGKTKRWGQKDDRSSEFFPLFPPLPPVRTSNRTGCAAALGVGCWMFDVGCFPEVWFCRQLRLERAQAAAAALRDGRWKLARGPRDHGTTGLRDYRTTGPQDHRTTGPQDHGPRDYGPGDYLLCARLASRRGTLGSWEMEDGSPKRADSWAPHFLVLIFLSISSKRGGGPQSDGKDKKMGTKR